MNQIYEINDDETVILQYHTNVLDTLNGQEKYLERVKEGMRQCASSGSCGYGISTLAKEHDLATKTGTAEVGNAANNITNALLMGFAPSENPTMSFVCVAPTSSTKKLQSNISSEVAYEVLTEYYKMNEKD